ncbi:MAG: hypothetical protein F6K24_49580 [Okeania sp. SIO2D1]|nr:hypothetical protein [Okeania sp. SIO2D1]
MSLEIFLFHLELLATSQSQKNLTPDWGMISAIIGFATLLAAIIIGIIQIVITKFPKKEIKEIKCIEISSVSLVKVDKKIANELEIFFQGKKIKYLTFTVLRVYNSGDLPITPSDFVRPISLIFTPIITTTEIIKAEILNATEHLQPIIEVKNNIIELEPLLMNSGDSFDISIITNLEENNINIDSRIVGIQNIKIEEGRVEVIDSFSSRSKQEAQSPPTQDFVRILLIISLVIYLIILSI